jgi:SAM-dependent methyltransferase
VSLPPEKDAMLPTESESPLHGTDVAAVIARYKNRIDHHGVSLESMASGGAEKQRIRHAIHATALRGANPAILDVGCGIGQFYAFLKGQGLACQFTGYDIVPEYVEYCKAHYGDAAFEGRNIFTDGIDGVFDSVVISQSLNNRYCQSDNMTVLATALEVAFRHTRVSVSVDMLSSYVDYELPDLYYYRPEEVFRIAKGICRRVCLRHDYRPFEFCIQLFHDGAEGYVP